MRCRRTFGLKRIFDPLAALAGLVRSALALSRHMSLATRKAIVTSATVTALIVIAFGIFLYQMFAKMCGNEILSEFVSPDNSKKIVVFQRDCGATAPFSTQASLLAITEKLPDEGGNVFSADTNHGAAPSGPGGGPNCEYVGKLATD